MIKRFTSLYPVWIIASSVLGLLIPRALSWFSGPWVVWALTVVMLGMGFTLTIADFRQLWRARKPSDSPAPKTEKVTVITSTAESRA